MATLRVGIDGHVLDGKFQGTKTWLTEVMRRAPHLTDEIEFILYTEDPEAAAALLGPGPVVHLPLPNAGPIARYALTWPRLVARDRLDFVITQYFCSPRGASRQIPVIHDVLFETHPQFFPLKVRWRNRLLVRWAARRAPFLMTVSDYSRDQIVANYHRPADEVAIVNNGVDAATMRELGARQPFEHPADGHPYALFVGRLEPRKNLRLALEALALLPDPDARLVVIGRDDFEQPDVLAALVGEPRAVHLVDVAFERLAQIFANASVLVYPSLGEGWGIPVLEALAAGTPVVASDVTAIPESGGDVTTYFSPTADEAARTLADLLAAGLEGRLEFDADAARRHADAHSWDRSAAQFVTALRHAATPR